jgi:hypothetical protein
MEGPTGAPENRRRPCAECRVDNEEAARFCKACGASLAPPVKCPKCEADVERDANFCAKCGTKLVGARPPKANGAQAAAPKEVLAREKAELPEAKKPSSNLMGNFAVFVAFVVGLIAVIVYMNKDNPKEVSPFQGGPPPARVDPPPPSDIPSGAPISGEIAVAAGLGEAGSGTLFVVLRPAGTPNQGPPMAVKRIDAPSFPQTFEVSQADVMMKGVPFLGPFDIYVRLDRDGNAMTKDAGDLVNTAPAAQIAAGATGVKIELDKRL